MKRNDNISKILIDYASSLGLKDINSENASQNCLIGLKQCHAKKGPITSWFYEIKKSPDMHPVFFSIHLLSAWIKDGRCHVIQEYDNCGIMETPSGTLKFGIVLANGKKSDAIVLYGNELVTLDESVQAKYFEYKINDAGYKIPGSFMKMAWGPSI